MIISHQTDTKKSAEQRGSGWLRIDLKAIATNYRILCTTVGPNVAVGAVVKANAYGLGAAHVAPILHQAGCRRFFVATVDEGLTLRPLLPKDSAICILNGPPPGSEDLFVAHALTPVLNSLDQVRRWTALCKKSGLMPPCLLQIDSGMSRFGLSEPDVKRALAEGLLTELAIDYVISHLACADNRHATLNETQRARFVSICTLFPNKPASLAASSGIFLGEPFHFDLVRPGYALYGGNPTPGQPNPMRPVVTLEAALVQDRWIEPGVSVGYNALFVATVPTRIATLAIGYADGFHRHFSGVVNAVLPESPDVLLPVVGRVSMDCITLDITGLGDRDLAPSTPFELIGPHRPLDELATALDTIGYELLTGLGQRFHREYIESSL